MSAKLSGSTRGLLVATTAVAMIVLVFGACQTSARLWAKLDPAHLDLSNSVLLADGHKHAAYLLLLMIVASLAATRRSGVVAWLALSALVAGLGDALTGLIGGPLHTSSSLAMSHALCGHIVFACMAAAAVIAMTSNAETSPTVELAAGFPLRGLALWIPPLIATQVAMGAAYRHEVWNVLPHMGGAMAAAFMLVGEGVLLLQRAPEHRLLHRAATWSVGIVIAQVTLGIADFLVRLLDFQDSAAWFALSIAHVTVGSLTFATSICLCIAVRAYVVEVSAEPAASPN